MTSADLKERGSEATLPGRLGIVVEGLSKTFGDTRVLDRIDFAVEPGTMLALLGPNGAGKTTTVRILTTLLRPDAGRATVGGYDVVGQPVRARTVLGLTGQDTTVDGLLTGRENLVMMGRLYRMSVRDARQRAEELLSLLDLEDAADRPVKTYSGGMKRRLDLAASLVATPSIMFLDEPTTGLDPLARQKVWDIIRDLMGRGTTVLLTTQYLEEADHLADRIIVMDEGRIVTEGSPTALKRTIGSERAELVFATSDDVNRASAALSAYDVRAVGEILTVAVDDPWRLHDLLGELQVSGIKPTGITVTQPTLDDVFLTVTRPSAENAS